eukprot:TRINITY_DN26890_c0_g2_i1.p2 TRINITY_DN26890_c0_g2~~TRINITY_DN26890_c0_g2_i1.p2  ORF type:complete len:271 (+),score=36.54 TRINITY_DN26890_c0_g2_i1:251-1063(+)
MPENSGIWLEYPRYDYAEMAYLQEVLRGKRQQGTIPDVAILLEHHPCITVGRSGGYQNLLVDNVVLKKHGITVHDTSRGGNITYHGPGQLILYPILSLEGDDRDLHAYARKMEEVMIRTLQSFGITAGRKPEYPGVWVGERKIGAMGIAVRKWITMYGIALNVCPDLEHFSLIVPCGIVSHGVTSMAEVLGHALDISAVRKEMRRHFSDIFQMAMRPGELEQLIEEDCLEKAQLAGTSSPERNRYGPHPGAAGQRPAPFRLRKRSVSEHR